MRIGKQGQCARLVNLEQSGRKRPGIDQPEAACSGGALCPVAAVGGEHQPQAVATGQAQFGSEAGAQHHGREPACCVSPARRGIGWGQRVEVPGRFGENRVGAHVAEFHGLHNHARTLFTAQDQPLGDQHGLAARHARLGGDHRLRGRRVKTAEAGFGDHQMTGLGQQTVEHGRAVALEHRHHHHQRRHADHDPQPGEQWHQRQPRTLAAGGQVTQGDGQGGPHLGSSRFSGGSALGSGPP